MRRLVSLIVLALLVGISFSSAAVAQEDEDAPAGVFDPHGNHPTVDVSVTTDANGVWVEVHVEHSLPGVSTTGGTGEIDTGVTSASAEAPTQLSDPAASVVSGHDPYLGYYTLTQDGDIYSLEPFNIGSAGQEWVQEALRQNPDTTPMAFYINGDFQGTVWVPNQTDPGHFNWGTPPDIASDTPIQTPVTIDPRDVALDILSHIPLPDLEIRANPSLGLVGMPSWFWVEGYGGAPFGDSLTVNLSPPGTSQDSRSGFVPGTRVGGGESLTVEVQVRPSAYEWSFGDGTVLIDSSLGKPYPEESDVQHTYQHSSLQLPGGFPVQLTIEFVAEYRINGGVSQELPSVSRSYQSAFRVQEMQPVLTGR
jgi:hypothetical protein